MKQWAQKFVLMFGTFLLYSVASAQCSICTKTAQQLGEETGHALNGAIIYLAAAPILVVGFISYRWWKNNKTPDPSA